MPENDFPVDVQSPTALPEIDAACWTHLNHAVHASSAPWRLPSLATQAGDSLNQRTVVLRDVDGVRRLLIFHTDVRSGKVSDIRQHAEVSLLFYDPAIRVQVIARGTAAIHTDDDYADQLWSESAPASLKMYLGHLPPGSISARPDCNEPESVRGCVPEQGEIQAGRCNFAVIVVSISELEWLQLSRDGNYRARFIYRRDDDTIRNEGQWLIP